ncbi:hypothetical protein G7Y89_g15218 [Cudoniella acicularis]|uniref:Uncharacterized protein n=1 Tax=Cudoniella acicularis TaxID=354080 RepID=A0A8H4QRZ8_9HELO|nr:hypothetical protein G7Y89_g15218 [Cudoniella acicularis]
MNRPRPQGDEEPQLSHHKWVRSTAKPGRVAEEIKQQATTDAPTPPISRLDPRNKLVRQKYSGFDAPDIEWYWNKKEQPGSRMQYNRVYRLCVIKRFGPPPL